jgi:hypothetical protein
MSRPGMDRATPTPPARRWIRALGRRWPTALALAMSAATWDGGGSDDSVTGLGEALPLLPLLYLIVCKIRRPRASWPVLLAGLTATVVLRMLNVIAPSTLSIAIALVVLVWAAVDGQLRESGMFQIQALGMLGFGALALAGLAVEPDVGRYLVAAGWLLHGIWDYVHLRLDKVVARSFAEWCGLIDILIAAQLLFLR